MSKDILEIELIGETGCVLAQRLLQTLESSGEVPDVQWTRFIEPADEVDVLVQQIERLYGLTVPSLPVLLMTINERSCLWLGVDSHALLKQLIDRRRDGLQVRYFHREGCPWCESFMTQLQPLRGLPAVEWHIERIETGDAAAALKMQIEQNFGLKIPHFPCMMIRRQGVEQGPCLLVGSEGLDVLRRLLTSPLETKPDCGCY